VSETAAWQLQYGSAASQFEVKLWGPGSS